MYSSAPTSKPPFEANLRPPGRPASSSYLLPTWFLAVVMFVMLGPFPQLFTGVDTMATGIVAEKSKLLFTKLALLLTVLPFMLPKGESLNLQKLWPLYLVLLVFSVSIIGSSNQYLSARGVFELSLVVIFATVITARLSPDKVLQVMFSALSIGVVLSVLAALIFPKWGVHNSTDVMQNSHAGLWRGVFLHKNLLGQIAAVHLALGIIYAPRGLWTLSRIALLALSGLALISCGSVTSVLILIAGIGTWAIFQLSGQWRALSVIALFFAVLLASFFRLDVTAPLLILTGKDATLTGRTDIWARSLEQMQGEWLMGRGYVNASAIGDYLQQRFGRSVGDVHSGYLDLLFTVGVFGLGALAILIGSAILSAFMAASRERRPDVVALAAILVMWMVAALSETSPFRPSNGLLLCGLMASAALLRNPSVRPRASTT